MSSYRVLMWVISISTYMTLAFSTILRTREQGFCLCTAHTQVCVCFLDNRWYEACSCEVGWWSPLCKGMKHFSLHSEYTFMYMHVHTWLGPWPSLLVSSQDRTLRNGQVNQVRFLGLANTLATCTVSPGNVQNILRPNLLTKGMDTPVEIKKIYCCKGSAM